MTIKQSIIITVEPHEIKAFKRLVSLLVNNDTIKANQQTLKSGEAEHRLETIDIIELQIIDALDEGYR